MSSRTATLATLMMGLMAFHPMCLGESKQLYAETFAGIISENERDVHAMSAVYDGNDVVFTVRSSFDATLRISDGMKYRLQTFFVSHDIYSRPSEGVVFYRLRGVRNAFTLGPQFDLALSVGFDPLAC